MQGRSTPYDLIRDGVATRIWVILLCVGYMTNDKGCRGASNSLFVVRCDERKYEYAERCTFLIC